MFSNNAVLVAWMPRVEALVVDPEVSPEELVRMPTVDLEDDIVCSVWCDVWPTKTSAFSEATEVALVPAAGSREVPVDVIEYCGE